MRRSREGNKDREKRELRTERKGRGEPEKWVPVCSDLPQSEQEPQKLNKARDESLIKGRLACANMRTGKKKM